jgi:hypothetical protein
MDRPVGAPSPKVGAPPRSGDAGTVDDFLQKLARAVQQFRTYPPTSPLCQNAIDAAHRAVSLLSHRDQIAFRVAPQELIVDEVPCGRGTIVEQELARRLHAASIAEVKIEQDASPRELSRFCLDLVRCEDRSHGPVALIELLADHGVDRIALRAAYRPEVLEVAAPTAPIAGLIDQQRQRRDELFATGGPVDHLYPPDKGWVRVDPAAPFATLSLLDLALLCDDPPALATMLLRLTDGESLDNVTAGDALAQKFADVATLFTALEPRVARVMFSKLSRAVLDLEPDRRQSLLRRTILPGLLDGRMEGGVLRDFPDVDLADSLCLLLDLETAAPEVVTSALARLDLAADRHAAVLPLLEDRLRARTGAEPRQTSVDAHARKLVHVDAARARSLAEFSAFDLSVDARTIETLGDIRSGIAATDTLHEQLECLWKLTRLEANPEVVQRFFDRSALLLGRLDQAGYWPTLTAWLTRHRELVSALADTRPDVAAVVDSGLAAFCTVERTGRLLQVAEQGDEGRAMAGVFVRAIGAGLAPALLGVLQHRSRDREAARKMAIALLCDHASVMAPRLVTAFGQGDAETNRAIARVLGHAGRGYETTLGAQLTSTDEHTVRETLRSLARIGTTEAAVLVSAEIEKSASWVTAAAEETLWRFPPAEAHRQVARLLGRRDFVLKHPQLATRLLERAAHAGAADLAPIAAQLAPLRFRIWNPALVRLARKAHALGTPR